MGRANNSSRALIEISKAQGWDSTRIYDQKTGDYTDEKFIDNNPQMWDRDTLGTLPGGVPAVSGKTDPSQESPLEKKVTWNHPDVSREKPTHGEKVHDPYPGFER